VLTLASARFVLAGGHSGPVRLRLGTSARALLAHSHPLAATLAIVAHDADGRRQGSRRAVLLHLIPAG
jgi:hypothetical protein